jgi:hypothetical protein
MTRPVHRHATQLPEYTEEELSPFQEILARDRKPPSVLDGLLAKPRRTAEVPARRPSTTICECGSPGCPIGPFVERV